MKGGIFTIAFKVALEKCVSRDFFFEILMESQAKKRYILAWSILSC